MNKLFVLGAAAGLLAACATNSGSDNMSEGMQDDVTAVIEMVQADNSDFVAFCKTGQENIRGEITAAVTQRVRAGDMMGDPSKVGEAAGAEIAAICRAG